MPPQPSNSETIKGFSRNFGGRSGIAIGIYGPEGAGKTHLGATATEWAMKRNTTPAWLVWDRKTRQTVRTWHQNHNMPLPFINDGDFISRSQALSIAQIDREDAAGNKKIIDIYTKVYKDFLDMLTPLIESPKVNPIILETGTAVWDVIAFSHFGKKQGAGRDRVWGPPKQDWTDLMDALSEKDLLISFWEKDIYENDAKTKRTKPDGPTHLGYTITSEVRMRHDRQAAAKSTATTKYPTFSLDIAKSQDNTALEDSEGILTDDEITFTMLMELLRPGDA